MKNSKASPSVKIARCTMHHNMNKNMSSEKTFKKKEDFRCPLLLLEMLLAKCEHNINKKVHMKRRIKGKLYLKKFNILKYL